MNTTASTRTSNPASPTNPLTREVARSNAAAASGSSATFVAFLAAQVSGAGTMFDRATPIEPATPRESDAPTENPSAEADTKDGATSESDDAGPQDSREPAQAPRTDRAPASPLLPGAEDAAGSKLGAPAIDAPEASAPPEPTLNPASGHPALSSSARKPGPQTLSSKAVSNTTTGEPAAPTDPLGLIPGRSGPTPPAESRAPGDAAAAQPAAPSAPAEASAPSGPRFSEHLSNSAASASVGDESAAGGSTASSGAASAGPIGAGQIGAGQTGTAQTGAGAANASNAAGQAAVASSAAGAPGAGTRSNANPGTPMVGIAPASGPSPLGKLVAGPLGSQLGGGPRLTAQEAETQGQVARGLASALKAKDGEVTLRLTPDTLGTVRITLRIEDQQVRATIETSTLAARDLLSKGVESLRAGLERRGLEVDRLEVRAAQDVPTASPPARSESETDHEQSASRDFSRGDGGQGGNGGGGNGGGEHAGGDRRNLAGVSPLGLVGDEAANTSATRGVAGLVSQGPTLSLERDGSATTLPDGRTVQALRLEAVA
ncbi:MAG: flagellar hook-length control protein FliK [Planctomycetota bacterium]|nr:flagellar hook-length control protein FliK [Planctomycetota bacterium]